MHPNHGISRPQPGQFIPSRSPRTHALRFPLSEPLPAGLRLASRSARAAAESPPSVGVADVGRPAQALAVELAGGAVAVAAQPLAQLEGGLDRERPPAVGVALLEQVGLPPELGTVRSVVRQHHRTNPAYT